MALTGSGRLEGSEGTGLFSAIGGTPKVKKCRARMLERAREEGTELHDELMGEEELGAER